MRGTARVVVLVLAAAMLATALASAPAGATAGVNLTVDLSDNDQRFTVGSTGVLTVRVRNVGTAASSGTVSVDTSWYPQQFRFVSSSGSGWSCASSSSFYETVTCQRTAAVAAGGQMPLLSLTVDVLSTAYSPGAEISSYSTMTNASDDDPNDNSDSEQTPLDAPDLAITDFSTPASTWPISSNSTTNLTVTNVGTLSSSGPVSVTVDGTAGYVDLKSSSGSGWSCVVVSDDYSCAHAGPLAAGASTPVLTVMIRPTASAYPNAGVGAQVSGAENPYTGNDYSSVGAPVSGVADLSIASFTSSASPWTVGTTETVSLDVTNIGTVTSTGPTRATFSLGAGLSYLSRTGTGWTCTTPDASTVACTRTGGVGAGAHPPLLTLNLSAAAAAYPYTSVSAVVNNGPETDPPSGPFGYNNGGGVNVGVDGVPDLYPSVTDYGATFTAGSVGSYDVSVINASTVTATGTTSVVLDADVYAPGMALTSAAGSGWTCGAPSPEITCTSTASIAGGATTPVITAAVLVDADNPGVAFLHATVSNATDVYPNNNTSYDSTSVLYGVDLVPSIGIDNPLTVQSTGHAYLYATNYGSSATSGDITIAGDLPAGLTPTAASGAGWSCSIAGQHVGCTYSGSIPASSGVPSQADITFSVGAAAKPSVNVCVGLTNSSDLNTNNNTACAAANVNDPVGDSINLSASASAWSLPFVVGFTELYKINASNNGTLPTTGTITMQLDLSAGQTVQSVNGAGWTCSHSTSAATCTLPALAASSSSNTIDLLVEIDGTAAPLAELTATVSGGGDASPGDNVAVASAPVGSAPSVIAHASATPTLGLAPLPVSFNGSTSTGPIATYHWDFGDGATSTAASPNHTYTTPGVYTALLTVSTSGGETDTDTVRITVGTSETLTADAGDDQVALEDEPATFDGGASRPDPGITSYQWSFSDGGSASGATATHTFSAPGTYTATLTTSIGSASATDTATVEVLPSATGALAVTVQTGPGAPLPGAAVTVIDAFGTRYQATTDAAGVASLVGLDDGAVTVYAYASGFKPAKGPATVTGGTGTATITLTSGSVAAAEVASDRLTYEEIEALGIDPDDPANQHVFEFVICLSFDPSLVCEVEFTGYANGEGTIYYGGVGGPGGGGGGSCSSTACGVEYDGYEVEGTIEFVTPDHPVAKFLLIPGEARWLKEFFEVKMVVTNLSPEGFTFVDGAATLELPEGLSLAPITAPQAATMELADIPGESSGTATWIVRGDQEGEYDLTAAYTAELDPVGVPVHISATTASPLKVWSGSALHMTVHPDSTATAGSPYQVSIDLTNVTSGEEAISVYNVAVELKKEGASGFIYQPLERLVRTTDAIDPGETVSFGPFLLVPQFSGTLHPENSAVFHTGGDTSIPSTIGSTLTPVPALAMTGASRPGGVFLDWAPVPGATGYRVFSTPTTGTMFEDTPVLELSGAGVTEATIAAPAGQAFYAVSTVLAGVPTMRHPLTAATALPLPDITVGDATIIEGNAGTATVSVPVRLSEPTSVPVSVQYATTNGTATTAGKDYVAKTGTITIAAGKVTGNVTVTVKPDVLDELDETLSIGLSAPVNGLIARPTGTVTIADDDNPPASLRLTVGDVRVYEGGSSTASASVPITLSHPSATDVTVRASTADGTAVAPGDYTAKTNVLVTIPAGSTSALLVVKPVGDTSDEIDESFTVTLATPIGAVITDGTATVTIADDDPSATPTLSIGDVTLTEGDAGTSIVAVPVVLSQVKTTAVTVSYATANGTAESGKDFAGRSGSVTIAAGKTTATLQITMLADGLDELDEGFTITLSSPSGATLIDSSGAVTILDDDAAVIPTVSIGGVSVVEGDALTATWKATVTLSAPSTSTVTAAWATSNGTANTSDYTAASGVVSFAPGVTTATISVTVKSGTGPEPDETFNVTLSSPSGATIGGANGTVRILDDD